MSEETEQRHKLQFTTWRDNSMGHNKLRFRGDFVGFDWRECRALSDETVKLAAKLCDSIERDLKDQ